MGPHLIHGNYMCGPPAFIPYQLVGLEWGFISINKISNGTFIVPFPTVLNLCNVIFNLSLIFRLCDSTSCKCRFPYHFSIIFYTLGICQWVLFWDYQCLLLLWIYFFHVKLRLGVFKCYLYKNKSPFCAMFIMW